MIPINLHVKNFPLTEAVENYVKKRLKAAEKFKDLVMHIDLHLSEERGQYIGVAVVKLKGKTLRIEEKDKDPMAVVDSIKEVMIREIKREKEKIKRERRRA